MRTAMKLLVGWMLMVAVSGCCCWGNRWSETCSTPAPRAPLAATLAPPQVTME